MDWQQIEKDYKNNFAFSKNDSLKSMIFDWFKQRIESELPPQPPEKLNEEERNEFYTTNVTAEIKPKYGK